MTDSLIERLRAMHDELQVRVIRGGGFKTLEDRERDCEDAMKVCWESAAELARLTESNTELLAALERLTYDVEQMLDGTDGCGDPGAECPMQDAYKPGSTKDCVGTARAAIAKAKAES